MTTTPTTAWEKEVRGNLLVEDVCILNDDYTDDQEPPWPYLASGPTVSIQSLIANNTLAEGYEYDDPLGHVVITPYGPVLRLEAFNCQGTMPASSYWCAETVYGSRETLEAIGAIDICEVPY